MNQKDYMYNRIECDQYSKFYGIEINDKMFKQWVAILDEISKQGHSGFSIMYLNACIKDYVKGNISISKIKNRIRTYKDKDDIECFMMKGILRIIKLADRNMELLKMLNKRISIGSLAPIFLNDDEWEQVDKMYYQNKKCSAIFKEITKNKPYYINAIIFTDENVSFSGTISILDENGKIKVISSSQYIKPFEKEFVPKTFYIDVAHIPYDESKHSYLKDYFRKEDDKMYIYGMTKPEQLKEALEYYSEE